jgi:pantoate kinase
MKKQLVVFVVLLFTNHILSQDFTQKDIVGKWKVVKILKKPESSNFNDMIKSFSSATFLFEENLNFKITTLDKTKLFAMLTDMTKDAKWRLNANNYAISIGNDSNKYSILKIIAVKVDDKMIFHLDETELDLEVQKE